MFVWIFAKPQLFVYNVDASWTCATCRNEVYRLWTSLFLHAGVIHLAITVVVQWFIMRDLERLIGPLRLCVLYFGSGNISRFSKSKVPRLMIIGILGNAFSAVFVPHRAESGPSGSHFGLLAALFVEVFNAWPLLKRPILAIGKLALIVIFLLLLGKPL